MEQTPLDSRLTRRSLLRTLGVVPMGVLLSAAAPSQAAPRTGAPAPKALAAPAARQAVTITFWKSPHHPEEKARIANVIAGFESENPGIKVEHTITPWDTWDETYTAAFASGSPPDVSYMPELFYVKLADAEQLTDLGPFVDSPDYANEKNAWYPDVWKTGSFNGKQVGLPNIGVGSLIYYNVDMWESLGLQAAPPKTYDEFVEVAKAGTKDGNWGYTMPTAGSEFAWTKSFFWFVDNGATFLDESLTTNGFNNDGGLRALSFLADLFCKHGVVPAVGSYNRQQMIDLFTGGKALMAVADTTLHGTYKGKPPGFKYDFFIQPPGAVQQTTFGNYGFWTIAEASRKKEEAWKFISYFSNTSVLGPFAELYGFLLPRGDYPMFRDDPLARRMQDEVAPKLHSYQLHPRLRQLLLEMWNEMEGAIACRTDPRAALQAAAARVDAIAKA